MGKSVLWHKYSESKGFCTLTVCVPRNAEVEWSALFYGDGRIRVGSPSFGQHFAFNPRKTLRVIFQPEKEARDAD